MPFANRPTHRVYYETTGPTDAPPVLLIMGLAFSSRAWDTLPKHLDGHFRVITLDNRGTGRSEIPPGFFRMEDMAADALAVLDDLKLESAHVFGVSMGGMVSLELALRHRGRVRSLALGCTMAGYRGSVHPAFGVSAALLKSSLGGGAAPAKIAPVLISDAAYQKDPAHFASWLTRVERAPSRVVVRQLAAVARHDTAERLRSLDIPSLVITGDADRLIPPENSRVLARLLPRTTLHELAGAGHCFPFERPDDTAAALTTLFTQAAA